MKLLYVSLAWILGTLIGASVTLPPWVCALGLVPLLLWGVKRLRRGSLILASCVLLALLGAAALYPLRLADPGNLRQFNDGPPVTLQGNVAAAPEPRGEYTRLELSADAVTLDGVSHEADGRVMVYVPRYTDYRYGDTLRIRGELKTPEAFDGFDYLGYLEAQGIYSVLYYPDDITIAAHGGGNPVRRGLENFRSALAESLQKALPEPQASLAQGVVLGWRGDIPQPLRDAFAATGTAHLLAISGLHLAIIAGLGIGLGTRLFGRRRLLYAWLALALVWGYALIAGLQTPVLRGAIMVTLFLCAEMLGRQRNVLPALGLAAGIMVAVTPTVLFTASFQLSFSAMLGLIFITPRLEAVGAKVIRHYLGDDGSGTQIMALLNLAFSVSLGAILATWPLVAWHFGIISLTGALATLLALPMLPPLIVLGALTGLLGLASAAAAQAIGWLVWLAASYINLVISGLAALPFASFNIKSGSAAWVWGYYALLALLLWWLARRRRGTLTEPLLPGPALRRAYAWVTPLVLAALLLGGGVTARPDANYHIYFVDTGQGDAALIRTPEGRNIVIDGGPRPQALSLALGRVLPYRERTIDLMVLTHPHANHVSGLIPVLTRYRVAQVLAPESTSDDTAFEYWQQCVAAENVPATTGLRGQHTQLEAGAYIEVLSPTTGSVTTNADDASIVLRLVCGDISFLFTGDVSAAAEWDLIDSRQVTEITVLKVAHHGSAASSSTGFLAVARPQVAVISVGADNPFGHPAPETLARLENVTDNIYRTDLNGTIEVITDGSKLWVRTER